MTYYMRYFLLSCIFGAFVVEDGRIVSTMHLFPIYNPSIKHEGSRNKKLAIVTFVAAVWIC